MPGVILLAGIACNVETTLDVWEGEHVRVESSPWLQVCGGTHERLDNFVPFMTAQLGLAMPPVQTYRWLESYDFLTSGCPERTIGCALGTLAVSQEPFLPHELVHTSLALLDRPYQPFFGEGIAEALDPWAGDGLGPIYLGRIIGREEFGDPRLLMTWQRNQDSDFPYVVARSFVMFLLARHGPAKFMAFTRELGASRDIDVIERTFQAAYGVGLDVETELFRIGTPCPERPLGPGIYDCTSPNVQWGDVEWTFSGVMDCASDEVAGGFGPDKAWPSIRSVTLEVPVTGRYDLRADSDGEVDLQIGPCDLCPWQQGGGVVRDSRPINIELKAGTHFMRIRAMSDESPSFAVVLAPETPFGPGI